MLTELSVNNFKSWKRIKQMRLAPITGLFGTNSSGKTSVLQLRNRSRGQKASILLQKRR